MNLKKRNYKYIFIMTFALLLMLIGINIYIRTSGAEIEHGIHFRYTHGFKGMRAGEANILQLTAFNVGNQDVDFLEDSENLCFNVEGIDIVDVQISHSGRIREVEMIALILELEMHIDTVQITQLMTKEGMFQIGSINLKKVLNSDAIRHHGVSTNFVLDTLFTLSLGYTNTQSFEIEKLIFNHSKIYNYEIHGNVFPINYTAGDTLMINMSFIFDKNPFDIFVLRPVLKFMLEGDVEYSFFVPLIPTILEVPMNYFDIREYINNA